MNTDSAEKPKLTIFEHVICAWPLWLIAVGGAIGGLCGGAAWALNTRIMRSQRSAPLKYILILLSGVGAAALYFVLIVALALAFPTLFAPR